MNRQMAGVGDGSVGSGSVESALPLLRSVVGGQCPCVQSQAFRLWRRFPHQEVRWVASAD